MALTDFTDEQLQFELDQLTALQNSTHLRRLEIIGELDRRRAYEHDGMATMVDWMTYRYGGSRRTARDEVRLAHELDGLTNVKRKVAEGRISWDKARRLATFVTPADDATWADRAETASYRQVRDAACVARRRAELASEQRAESELFMVPDHELGAHEIKGRLFGSDGETVSTALERLAVSFGRNESGGWDPLCTNLAQALVMMAKSYLERDGEPNRALVTIHVTDEALSSPDGLAKYPSGLVVSSEEARELSCDGLVQIVIRGANGNVLDIARRTRIVPPPLKRELVLRDEACVICGGAAFLEAHHVVHWAMGGETVLDNLVLLCWRCHTVLHRKRFRLSRKSNGEVLLIRPDGRPIANRPEPLKPVYRERILGPPSLVG